MNLEIMDIITLDDNEEFFVSNKTNIDGKDYYLLANEENRIMIGYVEGNEFVSIQDKAKFSKIIVKFDPDKVLGNYTDEEIEELFKKEE